MMATEPGRDSIFEKTQSIIQEKDLFSATEYLYSIGSEEDVVGAFGALILDSNHKAKSIEQVLHFGQAGIQYCLALAIRLDDDSLGMLDGYIGLSKLLDGNKESGERQFEAALKVLEEKDSEDTRFYIEQLHGARMVFESS
jgi:hypothetical protein